MRLRTAPWTDFIRILIERENDEVTFLYMRNGDQVYRLRTMIDFGEQLFPDQKHEAVLGAGGLWIEKHGHDDKTPISQRDFDAKCIKYQATRDAHAQELRKWRAGGKKGNEPHLTPHAALEAYRIARTGVIASAERAIATARRAIAWVDATRSSSYASPPPRRRSRY